VAEDTAYFRSAVANRALLLDEQEALEVEFFPFRQLKTKLKSKTYRFGRRNTLSSSCACFVT
jgi:hypothetical protein